MRHRSNARPWCLWLCSVGLPAEHIAILLDLEPLEVDFYSRPQRAGCRRPLAILVPDSGTWRTDCRPIKAQTADKVRCLTALGYQPNRIGQILCLRPGMVVAFLKRSKGARKSTLTRPRTKREQRSLERHQRLRDAAAAERAARAAPRIPAADAWRYTDGPSPFDPPPVVPAAVAELDQVVDNVPPVEAPAPARNEWVGSATWKPTGEEHGAAKLTWPAVRDVRRLHAAGWSCYRLARQLGVHPGTITAIVKNRTWVEDASPAVGPCPAP
jgi:hypothetical protein